MSRGRGVLAAASTAVLVAGMALVAACGSSATPRAASRAPVPASGHPDVRVAAAPTQLRRAVPRFAHIVVVILENHSSSSVYGNPHAPYLTALGRAGVRLTNMHGVRHPSEPNYLALFSGSTHGVTSDACPLALTGPTLAGQLRAAHRSFVGYSEGLPRRGFTGCGASSSAGTYARKHNPWVDFASVPSSLNRPLSQFPPHYVHLPTVAMVVPTLQHDMHDGTIAQADAWLHHNLAPYAHWALSHDSLLMITWDESDSGSPTNQIPTILYGSHLSSGTDSTHATTYTLLRTLEAASGLPGIGGAAHTAPLMADWLP